MSRPIFSPVAAVEAGVSYDPRAAVHCASHRTLTPGQRMVDGRVFYSAAWLDQATSTRREFPALKRRRDADRERSGGDAPSKHGADEARPGWKARVVRMERLLTVEFGPSRSQRFGKALAEAQSDPGEYSELEPGRYRVRFLLDEDAAAYAGLARLLERVRHWRATEVYEDDELVSTFHAREMAWCASSQLIQFRACRFRFYWGVPPRCARCPLFDAERAIRDALGENPPPGLVLEITVGPNLQALLAGELPPNVEPDLEVPDFLPEEWGGLADDEPPS